MASQGDSIPAAWDISGVVGQLRTLREQSLDHRQRRDRPPRLPARKVLVEVIEGLQAALFPFRLGQPDLTDEGVDYHVGYLLDTHLRALRSEIRRELAFHANHLPGNPGDLAEADALTQRFAARLPAVRALLETDLQAAYRGDPAARSLDEVLVCYPGIKAVIHYRLAHELHRLGVTLCARIISEIAHASTGIDIHPGATIGEAFFIDHGTGVVIGETAVIGRNVRLYHGVTLGAKRFPTDAEGKVVKGIPRHPTVEDDVVVYAGATILGRIVIGAGSTIGGNVWLTHSVPPGSHIAQSQARNHVQDGASARPGEAVNTTV